MSRDARAQTVGLPPLHATPVIRGTATGIEVRGLAPARPVEPKHHQHASPEILGVLAPAWRQLRSLTPMGVAIMLQLEARPQRYRDLLFAVHLAWRRDSGKFAYHLNRLRRYGLVTRDRLHAVYHLTEAGSLALGALRRLSRHQEGVARCDGCISGAVAVRPLRVVVGHVGPGRPRRLWDAHVCDDCQNRLVDLLIEQVPRGRLRVNRPPRHPLQERQEAAP